MLVPVDVLGRGHAEPQFLSRKPRRRWQRLHAAAPQSHAERSSKLPLDAAQAEKYMAISRAISARLNRVYKEAPDDRQLPKVEADLWDDEELLREGRELGSTEASHTVRTLHPDSSNNMVPSSNMAPRCKRVLAYRKV